MSRAEVLDRLIEDARDRLQEVVDEAMQEIAEVRDESRARKSRYHAARRELAAIESRIEELGAERGGLITRVAEANLEDDFASENDLRDHYRDLKHQLEALEARADALRGELAELIPPPGGDSQEVEALKVEMHLSGEVSGTAHVARAEVEEAQKRLAAVVEEAIKPLTRTHDEARGRTQDLGQRINWHPAVRYGKEAVR